MQRDEKNKKEEVRKETEKKEFVPPEIESISITVQNALNSAPDGSFGCDPQ